eukprot:355554-Chlamydomonas_euryale.AAC.1
MDAFAEPTAQSNNRPTGQRTNHPTKQTTDQPTDCRVSCARRCRTSTRRPSWHSLRARCEVPARARFAFMRSAELRAWAFAARRARVALCVELRAGACAVCGVEGPGLRRVWS